MWTGALPRSRAVKYHIERLRAKELVMPLTEEYVKGLPEIYRDILAAFPRFSPKRKAGYGLSYQSLYSALDGKYTLAEIELASQELAKGGAVEIRNEIFVHPTKLGEELIAAIIGGEAA